MAVVAAAMVVVVVVVTADRELIRVNFVRRGSGATASPELPKREEELRSNVCVRL